jgi:hypothetical protein
MMDLEKVLHDQWKDDSSLSALIPADHVWTEWSDPAQLPRAEIVCSGEDRLWLTSHSEIAERVRVTVLIWHTSFEKLRLIVNRIKAAYDRKSFDLGDDARILRLTYRREDISRHDAWWQGEVIFEGLSLRPVVT